MARSIARIKRKGQVTIPIDLRRDLHLEEGDTVVFRRTERGIEMIRPTDIVDATAGVFAAYAKHVPTDPGELRSRIAASIGADAARELEEQ